MRRSTEFAATIKQGVRSAQPDLVIHVRRDTGDAAGGSSDGPRLGLVVSKSVGSAVERHLVSRRLRHVARKILSELDSEERVVIRALPSSRGAMSSVLEQQIRAGLRHVHKRTRVER